MFLRENWGGILPDRQLRTQSPARSGRINGCVRKLQHGKVEKGAANHREIHRGAAAPFL
jgi:hypothetical protein